MEHSFNFSRGIGREENQDAPTSSSSVSPLPFSLTLASLRLVRLANAFMPRLHTPAAAETGTLKPSGLRRRERARGRRRRPRPQRIGAYGRESETSRERLPALHGRAPELVYVRARVEITGEAIHWLRPSRRGRPLAKEKHVTAAGTAPRRRLYIRAAP